MAVLRADIEAALRAVGADVKALRASTPSGPERLYRQGSSLSKRVTGPNIYDLLLSDKLNTVQRLSTAEVRRRLDAATRMGANIVRTHAWISLGKPDSLMPSLGVYNEAAFVALDVIVAEARKRGLYLWAPVTDRWNFYHGGGVTFAQLVAGNTNQADSTYRNLFYTDATTINAFKAYLTTILTRTNTITGLRYVDDPTLAIIETINEGYDAPASWTATILAHLRSIAPNTLLADGCNAASGRYPDGTNAAGSQDGASSLTQDCDIVGSHFYDVTTRDGAWLDKAAAMAVNAPSPKVFIVGEWGWTEAQNGAGAAPAGLLSRAAFCARLEANRNVSGDTWWSLLTDPAGATHDDGYQLYVPPQNAEQAVALDDLTKHAWAMRQREGRPASAASAVVNTAFSDDFTGSTGAPLNSAKWTTHLFGSGADAILAGGLAQLTTGTMGGYGSKAVIRSLVPARADRRVNFNVVPNSIAVETYFRVQLRGQGAGAAIDTADAIVFEINNSGYAGVKVRSGGQDTFPMGSQLIAGWANGASIEVEFEAVGTALSARWWLTGGSRPATPQWAATDGKLGTAGGFGMALNGGNTTASVTWGVDNLVITDITPAVAAATGPVTTAAVGSALGIFPVSAYGGDVDGTNDEVQINAATDAAAANGGGTVWLDKVGEYVCHAPIIPKAGVTYQGKHAPRYEVSVNPSSGSKIRVGSGFVGSGLFLPGNGAKGVKLYSVALVGNGVYNSTGGVVHGLRMPDVANMNGEQGWHLEGVTIAGFSGSGIYGTVWVWSIIDLFLHSNLRYGIETAGSDKWNDSKAVNVWCFFNRFGGVFFGGGMSAGLQFVNCRFERSGQVFGNPENNPVDANWIADAAGFRVLKGQLMQLTNCSTDANTGPGFDFFGLSADVNNIILTACGAFRDAGGTQSSTLPDMGGFRVSGNGGANGNTQNIQFASCYVIAGYSKDGGADAAKPISPKYGLQYNNALQTSWTGRPPAGASGDFFKQGTPYGCGFEVFGLDGILRYIRDGGTPVELTGGGSSQTVLSETVPTTPASGAALYAKRRGRTMPAWMDPQGHDTTLQSHMGLNKFYRWTPTVNAASIAADALGQLVTSNGGSSLTNPGVASSSFLAQCPRVRILTGTTAGTAGNLRGSALVAFLGNSTGMGGFDYKTRFGIPVAPNGTSGRLFVGLYSAISMGLASVNPSTLFNLLGVGWDAGQGGRYYVMTNDASGTATKYDTGINHSTTEVYEFHLFAAPGVQVVRWHFRAVLSGLSAEGTITTDLPVVGQMMTPNYAIGTSAAVQEYLDMISMTLETDN